MLAGGPAAPLGHRAVVVAAHIALPRRLRGGGLRGAHRGRHQLLLRAEVGEAARGRHHSRRVRHHAADVSGHDARAARRALDRR